MNDCIFCQIVRGSVSSYKVYENERIYAFLDIEPVTRGHTLIIPKQHYADLESIPDDVLSETASTAKQLASKYLAKLSASGFNLVHSSGDDAQQDVFHFHLHLIPRYKDAKFNISFNNQEPDTGFGILQKILTSDSN